MGRDTTPDKAKSSPPQKSKIKKILQPKGNLNKAGRVCLVGLSAWAELAR
jgi:hypothetical protein